MQTFVPFMSFMECARVLDRPRLQKQIVECQQIMKVLLYPDQVKGYHNHPAVKMWKGHEIALYNYAWWMYEEWVGRGYGPDHKSWDWLQREVPEMWRCFLTPFQMPNWWGDMRVHHSHRSMLYQKDPDHYRDILDQPYGNSIPDNLAYHWPTY